MAVLTQAAIAALHTTLIAGFNAGLATPPDDWKKIAGYVSSSSASNTYAWMSRFPGLREWIGNRLHSTLAKAAFDVPNRLWEATIDIPRAEMEDDQYGMYAGIAQSYGEAVGEFRNRLIFDLLAAANTTVCFDGQYLVDTDHLYNSAENGTGSVFSASNYASGAGNIWYLLRQKGAAKALYFQERTKPVLERQGEGSSITYESDKISFGARMRCAAVPGFWQCIYGSRLTLDVANFNSAFDAMLKTRGDGNRVLGIVPDTLVVGPSNRAAAEVLLKSQVNANGATNTLFNKVDLLVSPYLT